MTPRVPRRSGPWPLLALLLCSGCAAGENTDPITGFPAEQQRTVTRIQYGLDWPFEVAVGTLGCKNQAVAFRANGETYALNDAAARLGYRPVEGLVRMQRGGPPSNPLSRLKQEDRQRIFRLSMLCEKSLVPDTVARCKSDLRNGTSLTPAELDQVEVEGRERLWAPLADRPASIEPLTRAGLKLCAR